MTEDNSQDVITDLKKKVSDISLERKWAMSCYIPVVNIITCVLASIRMIDNSFVLYHARQGLVLFASWFATIVVSLISATISLMLLGIVLLFHIVGMIIAFRLKNSY